MRVPHIRLVWLMLAGFGALFALMEAAGGSTNVRVLLQFGADHGALALGGQPWRWISSGFIHIGIAHLIMNCWALVVLGPPLEELYGPRGLWTLFIVSTVAGGASSALFIDSVSAGASGGIFGLFGAYVVHYFRNRRAMSVQQRTAMERWLGSIVFSNLVLAALVPVINHAAHGGGFVGGLLLCLFLHPANGEGAVQRAATWTVTAIAMSALLMAGWSAGHIAENPWDYPTREFRDPLSRYSLDVPVWMQQEAKDGFQRFDGPGVVLAVGVDPEPAEWRTAVRESLLVEVGSGRLEELEENGWYVTRHVLDDRISVEAWHRAEHGRLYRVILSAESSQMTEFAGLLRRATGSFKTMP